MDDSADTQAQYAEVIWLLLLRNYQVYLFSAKKDGLNKEDFYHPRLQFLPQMPPPLPKDPLLNDSHCLWVTNHPSLERWLDTHNRFRIHLGSKTQPDIARIASLDELSLALDPLTHKLDEIISTIGELKKKFPQRAITVGIGAPPRSNIQDFIFILKSALQDANLPIVDTLDISSITPTTEACPTLPKNAPWQSPKAGRWLIKNMLQPLRQGHAVLIKEIPSDLLLTDIKPPIYLHTETILLLHAEMLFVQPLQPWLDAHLLLELPPEEQTRRAYEIPPYQSFDPKFTQQFLKSEGAYYQNYLQHHRVQKLQPISINFLPDNQP